MAHVKGRAAWALLALGAVWIGCSTPPDGDEPSDGGTASANAGRAAGGEAAAGVAGANGGRDNSKAGAGGGANVAGRSGAAGNGGLAGETATASGGSAGDVPEGGRGDAEAGAAGTSGSAPDVPGNRLTIFYLDVGGSVMATDVENPRARTIVEDAGQGPDGIAVDVEQGHIYWTGMGVPASDDGFILRSDLDGDNVVTIVEAGGTYTPKQLKIDHDNGKLYWSDREGMRVMRANLDGSELETLVTAGVGADDRRDNSKWCVGIALDLARGYFYWSQKGADNAGEGSLRRARLALPDGEDSTNRSDIEILFDGLPEPIDIDIDLERQQIYWTDRGDDTINRAPIEIPSGSSAANRTDRQILIEGVREAIGVTLDLARGKLYFTGGTLGRVGMANLDGSGVIDLLTGSAGLTGIAVVALPE
jgi:hypothetical protein